MRWLDVFCVRRDFRRLRRLPITPLRPHRPVGAHVTHSQGYGCLTTAYFNTTTLDGLNQEGNVDSLFQSAWNSDNALNSTGNATLSIATGS